MKIKEVECKSCMTKSKLTDYVINPYVGCQHGCKYCYATFIKKFQNIKDRWGEFCFPKVNCPDLLRKELEKNKPGNIWLSSVCDPYTPIEGKYKLTRKILETITSSRYKDKFSIEVLTKSALIKRDFDLLKKLDIQLGVSVNNLDTRIAKVIEPLASPPRERIKSLKEASELGIKTYGFISPVLPGITKLEDLFKELNFVKYVWIELLNTYPSSMRRLMPEVRKYFPEKLADFNFMFYHFDEYLAKTKNEARRLEKKYKLKVKNIIVHG